MHHLSGIWSGLFLNVLNSQDWWNVTIFEHDVIVIFWPQSISLINIREEFNVYVDVDNVDVYVEIFLTISNSFQPLITNTKHSILDFAQS